MLPGALHMRDEAGHDQDIEWPAAIDLIRQMHAGALDVARRRKRMRRGGGAHQRFGLGFRRNTKLVAQPLRQRRVVPFRGAAVA